MSKVDRQHFWNLLCNTHDNLPQSVNALTSAAPYPETLCRYRSVNENSLKQLQDNILWFSSADYYDDPFDTYFQINTDRFKDIYDCIRPIFDADNTSLDGHIDTMATLFGIVPDTFKAGLSNTTPDFQKMDRLLKDMREVVRRKLFSICFCENPLNETLWIKYAKNYHGFVLIYDFNQRETVICGTEEKCRNCNTAYTEMPFIYPVYYSNSRYDATNYALSLYVVDMALGKGINIPQSTIDLIMAQNMWEAERVTLIKKKCHENDEEWRMIRPRMHGMRTFIKARPQKIILGLRMPEYERRLVISAAKVAGIQEIHEMYINDSDELDSRSLEEV